MTVNIKQVRRESVDDLIERVMRQHPGEGPAASARYFEEVHQKLAPLARSLEREVIRLQAIVDSNRQLDGRVVMQAKSVSARGNQP